MQGALEGNAQAAQHSSSADTTDAPAVGTPGLLSASVDSGQGSAAWDALLASPMHRHAMHAFRQGCVV